jgi:integrase/recombinase XerD
VNLSLEGVDISGLKARINEGKGKRDRYVPIPSSFRGELAQYMENQKRRGASYLFETNRQDKFSTRWIREIIKRYALKAGIEKRVYPHLFRHQFLTYLAQKGLRDAKVQIISGHRDERASTNVATISRSVFPFYIVRWQFWDLSGRISFDLDSEQRS